MRRTQGFVMADALIATLIATLFASSLLGITLDTLNAVRSAEQRLSAALLAKSALVTSTAASSRGTAALSGVQFNWSIDRRERPPASGDLILITDVEVRIDWTGRHHRQHFELDTIEIRSRHAS